MSGSQNENKPRREGRKGVRGIGRERSRFVLGHSQKWQDWSLSFKLEAPKR